MGDLASQLTNEQMAELTALADGTLPADRRPAVEAWVATSPGLQRLLDRQRRSLAATQVAASEPMPASLGAAVQAERTEHRRQRRGLGWLAPRLAFGGAALAALTIALVIALGGGAAEPTVAEAAGLGLRPPTGPAPARFDDSRTQLAADVEGVRFPDFRRYGWRADGVRRDTVDGRDATVVYYRKGERRIAYVIVSGSGLPSPSGAGGTVRRGVEYRALSADGQAAVTWRRVGHTCVLTGSASGAELLTLASWRGGGSLTY
jgi:anti-sigma factor RsiW